MEKIIEKISSYNILNNVLPGIIFYACLKNIIGFDISKNNVIEIFGIYYFTGMLISRVGSILIEKILTKIKFIKYTSYKDYIKASEKDSLIKEFLQVGNFYRTMVALSLIVLVVFVWNNFLKSIIWLNAITPYIIIFSIIIIFLLAYKKQVKYIFDRTYVILEDDNNEHS